MRNICTYYEIENTYDEWHSRANARWATFQQALDDMENYSDWYRPRGTGTIYKVTICADHGKVEINRERILSK